MIRPTILVIDDDPLFRNLMQAILRASYHVLTASDGYEGYQLALQHRPAVAIVDLLMPHWDGEQTIRAIRAQPNLSETKCIVVSGNIDENDSPLPGDVTVDGALSKALFSRDALLSIIDEVLYAEIV